MSETQWVQMQVPISGGRADGRPWPDRLGKIEVSAAEAADLVSGGMAVLTDPPGEEPEPAEAAAPAPEMEPTVYRGELEDAVESLTPAPAAEKPDAGTELRIGTEAPKDYESKQAWVDHAVARGMSEDAASGMTKAELVQRYGG